MKRLSIAAIGLAVLATAPLGAQAADPSDAVKWHPGHYVTVVGQGGGDERLDAVLDELERHRDLRGAQIRYAWAALEPERGHYDFGPIDRDLSRLAAIHKRLFVLVQTKSFGVGASAVPAYLHSEEFGGGAFELATPADKEGGYRQQGLHGENIALWNDAVRDRLVALLKALGERFDRQPYLEGVALTETAMGRPAHALGADAKERFFRNQLIVAQSLRGAFPTTVTMQFVNFPKDILPWFVAGLRDKGVGLGGPDVFLDDPSLNTGAYPYYTQLSGVVPLGPSVQHEDYVARRARGPHDPPSVDALFRFARDTLHANYIFWTRRLYGKEHPYRDVLELLESEPLRNDEAGGLDTRCPKAYRACAS
jgi:hypothetical protein